MYLSVVTTSFNSKKTIEKFINRILHTIQNLKILNYEIIVVDDGSEDNTSTILEKLKKKYKKIKIIELLKNFGHHKALMTGLLESKGDYIFLLDSDLEENPENLKNFFAEIKKYDFVYGVQQKRKVGIFSNFFGNIFYKIFNLLSSTKIPSNLMTITLMRKKIRNELAKFNEKEIFFHGLIHSLGFKKKGIIISKSYKGKSEYTLSKKINLFFDAITSFSSLPLRIFFYFGLLISSFTTLYIIYLLFKYFALEIKVPGFTTIALLILFFGGIIVLAIGILGIYIHKIFLETKNRPRVIIKKKY